MARKIEIEIHVTRTGTGAEKATQELAKLDAAAAKSQKTMSLQEQAMKGLDVASKFDTSWSFLQQMKKLGVTHGKKWLLKHGDDVGVRASVDIQRDYLDKA